MRLKTSIKKISAIGLSLAMTIGMVPIWSTQALAETAQKAYEVILEPTMVYDNVYSSFGNKFIVSKNSLSGVVGEDGKEIIPCIYSGIKGIYGNKYLAQSKDSIWSLIDEKGNTVTKFQKKYQDMHGSEDELYGYISDEEGTDLLDSKGNVIEHFVANDSDLYTGTIKYDNIILLTDRKHFIAANYVKTTSDHEDVEHLYLITLDGKIVKDIGECTGWTDENNSIVRFVQYDEKNEDSYYNTGYVNMDGKTIMENNYDDSAIIDLGIEMYDNNEYTLYDLSTFKKIWTLKYTSNEDEKCEEYVINDKGIYFNIDNKNWYYVDKETHTKKTLAVDGKVSRLQTVGDNLLLGFGYDSDKIIAYIFDLNGNIKNKFEYKDVNYLANDINDSNGKILTLRYYTDDWKNEYVDAYDLSTGKKILQKYNDINTDDGKWFIAQKDGTLYLINSNGENIATIGKGDYGYVNEVGQFLSVRFFTSDGKYLGTYAYNNKGKKLMDIGDQSDLEKIDFVNDCVLVTKYGKTTSYEIIDVDGTSIIKGTDCAADSKLTSDDMWIITKIAIKDSNNNWKMFTGKNKATVNLGSYNSLYFSGNIVVGYNYDSKGQNRTYEIMSSVDGTMIIPKGQIEGISEPYDGNKYAVKVNGKWGIYKFNRVTAATTPSTPSTPSTPAAKITTPSNAKVAKVKAGKKKATISVKKVKGAKGYLVQYSTNKKFKGAKSKYVTKNRTTIKKLKSKKTYYFRVKAYKMNGKKKVFSKKWSAVKKVKVK